MYINNIIFYHENGVNLILLYRTVRLLLNINISTVKYYVYVFSLYCFYELEPNVKNRLIGVPIFFIFFEIYYAFVVTTRFRILLAFR